MVIRLGSVSGNIIRLGDFGVNLLSPDSIPRRIGSRMAARPASNRAVYSAIYRRQ